MPHQTIDYDPVAELYDHYVRADYDFAFFRDETAAAAGPVLELAAGTGRLSLPLAAQGVDLTCVDHSPGMLAVLHRKLAAAGLAAEVVTADLCQLALGRHFRLAILPFQSFHEIVGRARQHEAMRSVFAALVPGGRFVCTLHNPQVRRRSVDGVARLVGRFSTPDGTLVVSGFEVGGRPVVERTQLFELYGPDGLLRWKRLQPMAFELLERADFEATATAAGFRIRHLWGDYGRGPFVENESPVMLYDLERPTG
jgi:SAM-dependent methyltransferase